MKNPEELGLGKCSDCSCLKAGQVNSVTGEDNPRNFRDKQGWNVPPLVDSWCYTLLFKKKKKSALIKDCQQQWIKQTWAYSYPPDNPVLTQLSYIIWLAATFLIYAATHHCWPALILVHVAIAVPRALIAGWRLYCGAEEKVTTELTLQLQALSSGADASSHTHSSSPSNQGAPGGADGSTCREKKRKGADTPLIGEMCQEEGK